MFLGLGFCCSANRQSSSSFFSLYFIVNTQSLIYVLCFCKSHEINKRESRNQAIVCVLGLCSCVIRQQTQQTKITKSGNPLSVLDFWHSKSGNPQLVINSLFRSYFCLILKKVNCSHINLCLF